MIRLGMQRHQPTNILIEILQQLIFSLLSTSQFGMEPFGFVLAAEPSLEQSDESADRRLFSNTPQNWPPAAPTRLARS